jgi:hypothetical protein
LADTSIYGEIAQAIPVVIGGLLALGGGVIAQVVTHWLSISRDERNLRRNRLEALVKALYAHNQWLDEKQEVTIFRNENHDKPNPLDEVRMIQALHFPELAAEVIVIVGMQLPLLRFIAEQRLARLKDQEAFIKHYDNKPFLQNYDTYLTALNVTVSKCRRLLPAPQATLLNRLWKFLANTANEMKGK